MIIIQYLILHRLGIIEVENHNRIPVASLAWSSLVHNILLQTILRNNIQLMVYNILVCRNVMVVVLLLVVVRCSCSMLLIWNNGKEGVVIMVWWIHSCSWFEWILQTRGTKKTILRSISIVIYLIISRVQGWSKQYLLIYNIQSSTIQVWPFSWV